MGAERRGLLLLVGLMAVAVSGCDAAKQDPPTGAATASLPVYVLPVVHPGMAIWCGWNEDPSDCKPTAQAIKIQDTLTRSLVTALRQRGIDAQRGDLKTLPATPHAWLATGFGQPTFSLNKDGLVQANQKSCEMNGLLRWSDPKKGKEIRVHGQDGYGACYERYKASVAAQLGKP